MRLNVQKITHYVERVCDFSRSGVDSALMGVFGHKKKINHKTYLLFVQIAYCY